MQTHKEMTEQVQQIFKRLFLDIKEVSVAGSQGDEVWYNYIKNKIDTLTLEEQEVCLRYFFSTKLEAMIIKFAAMMSGLEGGKL